MTWLWALALVVAAFTAQWGASQLAEPLKAVRARFGVAAAAGGALVALASASSDIAVNAVSAVTGAGSTGLGNLLGSNVVSIPSSSPPPISQAASATWAGATRATTWTGNRACSASTQPRSSLWHCPTSASWRCSPS